MLFVDDNEDVAKGMVNQVEAHVRVELVEVAVVLQRLRGIVQQAQDVTRAAGVPAGIKRTSARWPVPASGSEVEQTITYLVDRSDLWTCRKGDRITEDANTGEVSIVEEARTAGGNFYGSHVEIRCTRV